MDKLLFLGKVIEVVHGHPQQVFDYATSRALFLSKLKVRVERKGDPLSSKNDLGIKVSVLSLRAMIFTYSSSCITKVNYSKAQYSAHSLPFCLLAF